MLSIIGTIIGLLGSFLPELLKFFKAKEDHKHEKEMFALQVQLAEKEHQFRVDELNISADIEETKAIYKSAEQKLTGSRIVDGLIALYNSSVRPSITYMFMGCYILVKYAQYTIAVANGSTKWDIIVKLWNAEDMAAFMTILGFWFGGRMLKAMTERYSRSK